MAVNISNRYLDLSPVVAGLADAFGYSLARVRSTGDAAKGQFPADWIVLTPGGEASEIKTSAGSSTNGADRKILWTDDHSNLFEILK